MRPARDIMIDDDTYQLLEEYYGTSMELPDVIENLDRDGINRLLDDVIRGCEAWPDDEDMRGMVARAREAKRRL